MIRFGNHLAERKISNYVKAAAGAPSREA